jgi:hypothetical protein
MDPRSGLKLVGCEAERTLGLEPPAPLNFKERAAMFPRHALRPRPHVELGGQPIKSIHSDTPPGQLPQCADVDRFFEWFGGRIDEVARELGLDPDDDTDRPRAA